MSNVVKARHLDVLACRRLHDELTRSACRMTGNRPEAEDIVQSALLRALECVHSAAPDINWRGWLQVVMRRIFADRARQVRQRKMLACCDIDQCPAFPPDGLPRWAHLRGSDFDRARHDLERSPAFCETYHLFYEKGLSYQQIALQLGVAVHTVASRLHRARAQLRSALEHAIASDAAGGG
jgi:RNA polymerase sigma-70 factor (ECF subfamily)